MPPRTTKSVKSTSPAFYAPGKELTLDDLKQFKVDGRYGAHVQDFLDEGVAAVSDFMAGGNPRVSVTDGVYSVHIMPSGRYLYSRSDVETPAPSGRWMGFWDPDVAPHATKRAYDRATVEQRMHCDATVQLEKYIRDQFVVLHAEFWCFRAYQHWWWEEGGGNQSMHNPQRAQAEFLRKVGSQLKS